MTKTNKTVAERLRDMADNMPRLPWCALPLSVDLSCYDNDGCRRCHEATVRKLADMIEAEQAELRERVDECNNTFIDLAALDLLCDKLDCGDVKHRSIAEQIRKAMKGVKPQNWAMAGLLEGVNVPFDAEGQPCCLDDGVYYKDRLYLVVAISHKGKVCIRDWEKRNRGDGAVWVKAERVTHRKPDTQEAIDTDLKEAFRLAGEQVGDTIWLNDTETLLDRVEFILERQRKLMGGE